MDQVILFITQKVSDFMRPQSHLLTQPLLIKKYRYYMGNHNISGVLGSGATYIRSIYTPTKVFRCNPSKSEIQFKKGRVFTSFSFKILSHKFKCGYRKQFRRLKEKFRDYNCKKNSLNVPRLLNQ